MDWIQDFETGLADIDAQHRYIFALTKQVNQLGDTIERVALRPIADELCRLALCHFGCEERLITAYNYPNASGHIAEHDKIVFLMHGFECTREYHARELALFLCNWLVSHTMLEDRQLGRHVLKQRALAMGMSVNDFVERIQLCQPPPHHSTVRAIGARAINR